MQNSTISSGSKQIVSNFTQHSSSQPEKLSDKELFQKCQMYGAEARLWRQKFIGLLPEVNRRRLYEKKGFSSIFEFAFKLCGLSKEQVYLALNLEKRFENKPVLKGMLENGEVSINKLARVVSIATPENEEELAEKVKVLPQSALETFVRDEKCAQQDAENANGLLEPLFDDKSLRAHASPSKNRQTATAETLSFEIDDDVKQQLNELNSKGIDVNKLLREMLKRRQKEITETKEEIAKTIQLTTSHYIAIKIRNILKEEHGKKCSITTCKKPATIIHHTQRFSLSRNHDPRFLAPLCREHHVIAHSVDLKYYRAKKLETGT